MEWVGQKVMQFADWITPDLNLGNAFVYKDPIARELFPEQGPAAQEINWHVNRWLMPTVAMAIAGGMAGKWIPDEIAFDPRNFIRWVHSKSKAAANTGTYLPDELVREMMQVAQQYKLKIRALPEDLIGHPGKAPWDVPHIHIGNEHVPVRPGFTP